MLADIEINGLCGCRSGKCQKGQYDKEATDCAMSHVYQHIIAWLA
jgi:hypothetical protein